MARKRIARIGDKGTQLPPRLRYSRDPSVLGSVGADASAAVWECRWSPAALAYLASLDIPAIMLRHGIRHNQRTQHMAGFGIDAPTDIDVHIARILKVFPRMHGFLPFARDLRRNLRFAIQGGDVGTANISLLARTDGAWGVLHEDTAPENERTARRMLVTLPTAPDVRSTILDGTTHGLPPLAHDGQLFGSPEDGTLVTKLVEMKPGQFGMWNMRGRHRAHVHSEPRIKIKHPHRVALLAKRSGTRPQFLRMSRDAPVASSPRLTVVVSLG